MSPVESLFVEHLRQGRHIERLIQRCEFYGWSVHQDPDCRNISILGPPSSSSISAMPEAGRLLMLMSREVSDYIGEGRPCRLSPHAEARLTALCPEATTVPLDVTDPSAELVGRDRQRADSAWILEKVAQVAGGIGIVLVFGALCYRVGIWWNS